MGWTFYNSNGEALIQNAESEATQAEMEAETAGAKFVPPDLVRNSPGVAKAWCDITAAGVIGSPDYNVASVTDTDTGDRTIVWDTDFSGTTYVVTGTCADVENAFIKNDGHAAGSVRHLVVTVGASPALVDAQSATAAFGDQ